MFSLMKVEISTQVRAFIAALAPEPRKKLRQAIQLLSQNKGNIKPLVDELDGFHRLRVGDFRVIYRQSFRGGSVVVSCVFAERREVVYQHFTETSKDKRSAKE